MPLQPDGRLDGRTMPSPADHLVSHFDIWRAHNLGTTTAAITVPAPASISSSRRTQLAIQTLYATAVGSGAKLAIKSGTVTLLEYRLLDGYPLELNFFPGNLTAEPGENLVIEVTGATSNASVTATGVFYR
jgi:hypothetical protein